MSTIKEPICYPDNMPFWSEENKWANLHFALYYHFVDGNVSHYNIRLSPEIGAASDAEIKEICKGIIKYACDCTEASESTKFFDDFDLSLLGLDNEVDIIKEELVSESKRSSEMISFKCAEESEDDLILDLEAGYVRVYGETSTSTSFFEECYNRCDMADFVSEFYKDFDTALKLSDATFYAYACYDENQNLSLRYVMESEEFDYHDVEVPLTDKETSLLETLSEVQRLKEETKKQYESEAERL